DSMQRLHQSVLISSIVLGSWLGMQAVHEFGHVLGVCVTGGGVKKVVLHPLTLSRTEFADNPRPLLVVWAGPLVGISLPLAGWFREHRLTLVGNIPAALLYWVLPDCERGVHRRGNG